MSLVEFLRARLDEDEQFPKLAPKLAANARRRMLAEVDAKRRIVDQEVERMRSEWRARADEHRLPFDEWQRCYPTATLRLLALPHADHRDYDESWRP